MGVEDRDWYREDPPRAARPAPALVILLALVAVLLVGFGLHFVGGGGQPNDPEHQSHHDRSFQILPGLEIPISRAPLYAKDDPWATYLADEQTCPHGEDANAPLSTQATTMVCLIDYARERRGLGALQISPLLSVSSRLKSEEIERCRVFAHAPCGGDAHDVADQAGYIGAWGENIYIADGRFGAPRVALDGWLNSPGHRANLFDPNWRVHSLYVVKLASFPGFHDPTLWVSEFGDR